MVKILWGISDLFDGKISAFVRYCIIKKIAANAGDNVYIGKNVTIKNPENLSLGKNISIHNYCYIDAAGKCSIGDNVSIAHASSILTFEHTWDDIGVPIKYNPIKKSSVSIADDVWIGCGARVLAGSVIESRCVVAAGAIVTHHVAMGSVVAGVPAKIIKKLTK